MGVRGLTTFFNNNPDLSKPFKLKNSSVIVDGNNLFHLLYFSNKVDCVYGGDYNRYAATIRRYFKSYFECNIKPIVIFDGGYDVSDRKFKTVLLRSKNRLTVTQHIAKYGECSECLLPINAQDVFRSILQELDISFAQCDYEADDQVTALANHYKCPVISDDSDFYIFDILNGFIKLSSIESTVHVEISTDGNKCKYLKCQIYYIDKFLKYFPGIDRSVLPLFGTLVGNDFAHTNDFDVFYSNIQLPKQKYKGLKVNQRQRKIIGVLSWLRYYNLEEGVKQVLSRFKTDRREHIKSIIEQSVNGYKLETCNLVHILDRNDVHVFDNFLLNTKLIAPCGEVLPVQFITDFHRGYLPSFFLNVINLHRIFLLSQVENTSLDSSFTCSRHIRQVIYGVLLQHPTSNSELHKKVCLCPIEEYDRRSGSIQRFVIEPLYKFESGDCLPKLNQLYEMKINELKENLLVLLNCPKSLILSFPKNWQSLFASVIYWLKNSSSSPAEEFIYALIICIIYFSVLNETISEKHHTCLANNECIDTDFYCLTSLINSISTPDATSAAKNLKKYLQRPVLNCGNPLNLHIVHSYSQLQTCILYSSYLNALFGFPLEYSKLHEALSGSMIYNLTKDILSRPYPDLFVSEMLGRHTPISELFQKLKSMVFKEVSSECYTKIGCSECCHKKHSTSKKKRQSLESNKKSEQELSNRFLNLFSLNDESDVDNCNEIFI